jgi:hypothetical protein
VSCACDGSPVSTCAAAPGERALPGR